MSKHLWLMSAGLFALAAPAHAQDNSQPVGQDTATEAGAVQDDRDLDEDNEIVITAQGRAQALQDVPVAVTAINAESMQNSGATDIRQLNQLAPSLLVSSTGTEANGSARIRGIGTVGDNPGLESSVATFIDGVYRSRTGAGLNELGEIERVEVLRGPQGTLFGRNASAGLINVVSKKPNLDVLEGYGEASYGNYDFVRLGGGITGPVGVEGLGFRLDGVYVQRDGFYRVDNPIGVESRVNDRDRYFVRGQLLYEPTDDIEVRLIGDYTNRNESCCGAVYISTVETFDATTVGQPAGTNTDGNVSVRNNRIVDILRSLGETFPNGNDPFNRIISVSPGRTFRGKTEDMGVSGQVDWNLGFGSLTSITAYRDYKAQSPGDVDYSRVDLLFRDDNGNSFREFKTFSQELRLQGSAFDDRFDWLVGAYYAKEDLHVRDNLNFGSQYGAFAACRLVATINPAAALRDPSAPGCLSPTGRATITATGTALGVGTALLRGLDRLSTVNNVGDANANYFQDSENYAFFTHNIFNVTDQISVTLGARYTNETKKFDANFVNTNTICPAQRADLLPIIATSPNPTARSLLGGALTLACQGNSSSELNGLVLDDERSEDEWTGTAILSYKPVPEVLIYGSYAKGYKAGGFNLDRSALGGQVAPFPTSAASANLQFDAEKVDAYEVGVKLDGPGIDVNLAAFRQDFRNFQLNTFNGSVFLVQNINSCTLTLAGLDRDASAATGACPVGSVQPGVTTQGIEVEAFMRPIPDVALTAGLTYADTKFRRELIGRNTGTPLDPALFLLPDDNLSNAPKYVATGSVTFTPELTSSGISGLVYVDARWTSGYNTGSDLFPEKEQDSYAVINARLGIRGPGSRWGVELFAQNLFDEDYQQVAFNTPFQGSGSSANVRAFGGEATQTFSSFLAEPRTYGVTVRGRF